MNKIKFKSNNMSKEKKRSFYVALGICLMAVIIASFVTYNNVKNYVLKESLSKQSMEIGQKFKNDENKPLKEQEYYEKSLDSSKDCKENGKKANVTSSKKNEVDVPVKAQKAGSIVYPSESRCVLKNYSGDNPVFSRTFNDWRTHRGVDISMEKGDVVKSITNGTVKNFLEDPILGNTIEIEHEGGFTAFYSGLSKEFSINLGDKVESGQEIGKLDVVPGESEDGYHLHLAIKKADKFIDPMEVLGKVS